MLTIPGHNAEVAFTPDGASLVSVSEGNSAIVCDIAPSRKLLTLSGHTGWVWGVAFSPDGARIATAGFDQTAKVWDISTTLNAGAATGQVLFILPEGAHTELSAKLRIDFFLKGDYDEALLHGQYFIVTTERLGQRTAYRFNILEDPDTDPFHLLLSSESLETGG